MSKFSDKYNAGLLSQV